MSQFRGEGGIRGMEKDTAVHRVCRRTSLDAANNPPDGCE
jgi:hypothetical protein